MAGKREELKDPSVVSKCLHPDISRMGYDDLDNPGLLFVRKVKLYS
jgi:hypothetical protein